MDSDSSIKKLVLLVYVLRTLTRVLFLAHVMTLIIARITLRESRILQIVVYGVFRGKKFVKSASKNFSISLQFILNEAYKETINYSNTSLQPGYVLY